MTIYFTKFYTFTTLHYFLLKIFSFFDLQILLPPAYSCKTNIGENSHITPFAKISFREIPKKFAKRLKINKRFRRRLLHEIHHHYSP